MKHKFNNALCLGEILKRLSPVQRRVQSVLAGKPSPSILCCHDTGDGNDYYADFVWHSLTKERSYSLPERNITGIIQPNTDIAFMMGFALPEDTPLFNCNTDYILHTHDSLVQDVRIRDVRFGWLKVRLFFLSITSSGILVRAELTNSGTLIQKLTVLPVLKRTADAQSNRYQREYYYSYGSTRHSVHTSTGELIKKGFDRKSGILSLIYNEHPPKDEKPAGKIICALLSESKKAEPVFTDNLIEINKSFGLPSWSGLHHQIILQPCRTETIRLAIQFHRFNGDGRNPHIPDMKERKAYSVVSKRLSNLLKQDEIEHLKSSVDSYKKMPLCELPERESEPAMLCSLDAVRGSVYSPAGALKRPFYNFCRMNAAEPWEWWSYGQHAHESISLINGAITSPGLMQELFLNHLDLQEPDGKVPYGVSQNGKVDIVESTMPVLSWLAWNIFLWSGDKKFLKHAFKGCSKYHSWWMKNRTDGKSILCNWLSVHETVRDIRQMPVWNVFPISDLLATDANSCILSEEQCLAQMASVLGNKVDEDKYRKYVYERRRLMNLLMWDKKDGCYYGINRKTYKKLRVKDFASIMPIWSGTPVLRNALRLSRLILDPGEFGTPYPVASLALSDRNFGRNVAPPDEGKTPNVQGSAPCMGDNWPELTYLIAEGLERYNLFKESSYIAYRNVKMVFDELISYSHFREHYDSISGFGTGLYDYTWSSIASSFLLRFVLGVKPCAEGLKIRPELPKDWDEARIRNLHIRKAILNLTIEKSSGENVAHVNGRKIPIKPDGILIPWNSAKGDLSIHYISTTKKRKTG